MMHSTVFKVVGAFLVMIAVLLFLFHGPLAPSQPQPAVHSTLTPSTPKSP